MIEILKFGCTLALIAIVVAGAIITIKIIGIKNLPDSLKKIKTREKIIPFILLLFFWGWLFNPNSTSLLLSIFIVLLLLECPLYYALPLKYRGVVNIPLNLFFVFIVLSYCLFNAEASNLICDNGICKITTENLARQEVLPEKTIEINDIQSFDVRKKYAFNRACAGQYYITVKYKNGTENYFFKSPSCDLDKAKETIKTLNQSLNNSKHNVNLRYPF